MQDKYTENSERQINMMDRIIRSEEKRTENESRMIDILENLCEKLWNAFQITCFD